MKKFLLVVGLLGLVACENGAFNDGSGSVMDTANRSYYRDDDKLVAAKVQFKEGNFGRSYTLFDKALDVTPNDPEALLGYAASADMLGRFDKADVAYRKLRPIIGNTLQYHNNYGYSNLLRGNLTVARQHFLIAYEMDPSNEFAANNLELLRNSINYPRRAPGDLNGI
ncbi:tetratricopeptide repeat protein [Celeribacter sp. PS-C1]|uniref:tetratricopeptide repeat protein n=1 Tax=Celeribacter sp. PS-C1 TaxID=2820813 RepID=UPI001CA4FA8E|nr:tetratricopeptide repeat protein [Celeribacter sp. PS-C1]MBW6417787.1 tetratricopeptide repeat protein [Celeribacter sp. PS-C1]